MSPCAVDKHRGGNQLFISRSVSCCLAHASVPPPSRWWIILYDYIIPQFKFNFAQRIINIKHYFFFLLFEVAQENRVNHLAKSTCAGTSLDVDHIRAHQLQEDDHRTNFSPIFISSMSDFVHVHFDRVLFLRKARRLSLIWRLPKKRGWEGRRSRSNAGLRSECQRKEEEYNQILRGITTSRRLFIRSAFSKISNNWRSYEEIIVKRDDHKSICQRQSS